MNIAIAGTGYVGLSLAVLLAQHNCVKAVDIVQEKIELINMKKSPILDKEIEKFFAEKSLNLIATTDGELAYSDADYVIIATPTNYDVEINQFDTSSIESVLKQIKKVNPTTTVIIKSTVPVGYLEKIHHDWPDLPNVLFSPEFLREGRALYDNLHPSRIIVGIPKDSSDDLRKKAKIFTELLQKGAIDKNIPTLILNSNEAESIKLFANAYLALRVAFFNELDTYAELHKLDTKQIIQGIGLDPRIGSYYNNPSFGYGGYCLPKDTRQLQANYKNTPSNIIAAIVASNNTRKNFITKQILSHSPKKVGIYRLIMKSGSDNFRESAIHDIMKRLHKANIEIFIYEPTLKLDKFENYKIIHDFNEFKDKSDLIVANRFSNELNSCIEKVYTRDIFEID